MNAKRLPRAECLLNLGASNKLIKVRHFKNLNRFISDVMKQIEARMQRLQLENRPPQVGGNLRLRFGLLLMLRKNPPQLLD